MPSRPTRYVSPEACLQNTIQIFLANGAATQLDAYHKSEVYSTTVDREGWWLQDRLHQALFGGHPTVWSVIYEFDAWMWELNRIARESDYLTSPQHPHETLGATSWFVNLGLQWAIWPKAPKREYLAAVCDTLWKLLHQSDRDKLDPRLPAWPEHPTTLPAARNAIRPLLLFLKSDGVALPYPGWKGDAFAVTDTRSHSASLDTARPKDDSRPDAPTVAYCLKQPDTVRWAGAGPVKLDGSTGKLLRLLLGQLEQCRMQFKNTWRENFSSPTSSLSSAFPRAKGDVAPRTIANRLSELNDSLEAIAFPLAFSYVDGCVRLKPT
jgi:hypothetical protein